MTQHIGYGATWSVISTSAATSTPTVADILEASRKLAALPLPPDCVVCTSRMLARVKAALQEAEAPFMPVGDPVSWVRLGDMEVFACPTAREAKMLADELVQDGRKPILLADDVMPDD